LAREPSDSSRPHEIKTDENDLLGIIERGHIERTIEWALDPDWAPLFDDEDRRITRATLKETFQRLVVAALRESA
jgi:hypothetical protein